MALRMRWKKIHLEVASFSVTAKQQRSIRPCAGPYDQEWASEDAGAAIGDQEEGGYEGRLVKMKNLKNENMSIIVNMYYW